jgi:hypothetical protein
LSSCLGQRSLPQQQTVIMTAPYLNRLSLPNSYSHPCISDLASPSTSSLGPTQILDYLYLGSQDDALDLAMLKKHGITKVINLSESGPRPDCVANDEHHFLRIPIKDSYAAKLLPHLDRAFDFIEDARETNQKVLVHCLAGISRSATLAIAYVMRSRHLASDEAYRFVKARRPSISPNFNFMGQLLEYEKQLRETNILPPCTRPRSFNCPTYELPPNAICSEENEKKEKSLCKSASSDFVLASNENRKRTIETPLALPERPRQLMKQCAVTEKKIPLRGVQEDLPSPSTEFSKLDISLTNPCFGLASAGAGEKLMPKEHLSVAPMFENPMFSLPSRATLSSTSPSIDASNTKKTLKTDAKAPMKCCKAIAECCKHSTPSTSAVPSTRPSTHQAPKASFFRPFFRKGKVGGCVPAGSSTSSNVHSHSHCPSTKNTRMRFRRLPARLPFDVLPTVSDAIESEPAKTFEKSGSLCSETASLASATSTDSPVIMGDSPESGFADDYTNSSVDSQTSENSLKESGAAETDTAPSYKDPERESISSASSMEIAVQ